MIELSANIVDKVKRLMGWCPVADTKINEPSSGDDYANKPKGGGDASGKLFGSLFEWDYIVKEEMWRSIAVLFYAFISIGMMISYGFIKADLTDTFFLAPFATFVFFTIMIWYRKTIKGFFTYHFENIKPLRELAILAAIYALYISLSLQYPMLHKAWILILLFTASKLGKIFELNRPTGIKIMLFFVSSCAFILIRYYVLQMPLLPILEGMLALGISMLVFVVLARRAGFEDPDYLHRMDRRGLIMWISIISVCVLIGVVAMIGIDKIK